VAIDFSDGAHDALRQAKLFLAEKPARIIALHVIDSDFITECILQYSVITYLTTLSRFGKDYRLMIRFHTWRRHR